MTAIADQTPHELHFPLILPPDNYPQLPPGLSLAMIVKNEERFLAECLASVKDAVDEMCILDTGSTDRTVEIAKEFGARVEFMEWPGDFAAARNRSLEMAQYRWTMVLDADEELAPEAIRSLRGLADIPSYETVVYCRIHNSIDDHGSMSMMSHSLPRIFPTTPRIRYKGIIHEALTIDGGTGANLQSIVTPIRIIHKGYTHDVTTSKEKSKRNAPLLVEAATDLNDSFAQFNVANYFIGQGKREAGVAALERFYELEKGREPRAFVPLGYVTLACGHAELGNHDRAHEVIDTCLALLPNYVLATFTKGEIYARSLQWDTAREWFHKTIKIGRMEEDLFFVVDEGVSKWKAQFNIAMTFLNQGRWDDAAVWLEIAYSVQPKIWDIAQRLAMVYEARGAFAAAEKVYRGSESEFMPAGLSGFLCRQQRLSEAQDVLDDHLDPFKGKDAQVGAGMYVARSCLLARTASGDPLPDLNIALALSPGHGLARALFDEVLRRGGDEASRKAFRDGEMGSELKGPCDYTRRVNRMLCEYPEKGTPEWLAMVELMEQQLGTSGVAVPMAFGLTVAHGTSDDAVRALSKITVPDPDILEVCSLLRSAYFEREGKYIEALRELGEIRGAHADLLRVKILEEMGRVEEAEEMLDTMEGPAALIEQAALLLRRGDTARAKDLIYEALNAV